MSEKALKVELQKLSGMLIDQQRAIALQRDALREAENALMDYIPQLEAKGSMMNYGHSVLAQVRAALGRDSRQAEAHRQGGVSKETT